MSKCKRITNKKNTHVNKINIYLILQVLYNNEERYGRKWQDVQQERKKEWQSNDGMNE